MKKIWIYSILFIISTLLAQSEFDEVRPYQIINADKVVSTRELNDEYITNLTGDVHFFYGETEFYADLAQIFEKQEIVLLEGNVQVYDDTLSMFSRTVKYIKPEEHLILRGDVLVIATHRDSTRRTFRSELVNYYRDDNEFYADEDVRVFDEKQNIAGNCGKLVYLFEDGYGYMMKSPRLFLQQDDTLMVSGEKIEYFNNYKKIVATFDVVTESSDFVVTSDFLIHYVDEEKAIYQGDPELKSEFADARAEEFQLFFIENKPEKAVLQDSCLVYFKTPDSDAKSNWVSSEQMEFSFVDGNISVCDAEVGVNSHFSQKKTAKRDYVQNDASGDRMKVFLNEGNEIESIDFIGNVKGKYKFREK